MSLYSVYDLSETLRRVRINRDEVKKILYAWGSTWGPNSLILNEPYDSIKGDAGWEGGFIILLKDGRVLGIKGSCDSTGWGCVDTITLIDIANFRPNYSPDIFRKSFSIDKKYDLDKDPIDLNRWINKEFELDSK